MPGIYGILGVPEGDTSFVNQVGQIKVFNASQEYLALHNEQLEKAIGIFVEEDTTEYLEGYTLIGGGRLQRRSGHAQSASVKGGITYNASYPIFELGVQLALTINEVARLKLTGLQKHLDTVRNMDISTVREEMLAVLFNNTQNRKVRDEDGRELTILPLANGDSQKYPPLMGLVDPATDNHYFEAGYLPAGINDSSNPIVTLVNAISEHNMNADVAVFIHPDQEAKVSALSDYTPVQDRHVRAASNSEEVMDIPTDLPGEVIGRTNGAWIVKWRAIPTGYMLGIDLSAPGPLKRRLYPRETGIEPGLQLVSKNSIYPFDQSHYQRLEGYGVGNRLSAAVIELATGGSYTIPPLFAD